MYHTAILGVTGSGKTHAAQCIARAHRLRGGRCIALTKELEFWPRECVDWQTDSPDKFARMYWACRSVLAFMELSDADVEKFDGRFHRMFTRGRHNGIRNYYLTQYAADVHPKIRANCIELLLFNVSMKGAKLWAEEFNDPALIGAATLPARAFFRKVDKFSPAQRFDSIA